MLKTKIFVIKVHESNHEEIAAKSLDEIVNNSPEINQGRLLSVSFMSYSKDGCTGDFTHTYKFTVSWDIPSIPQIKII